MLGVILGMIGIAILFWIIGFFCGSSTDCPVVIGAWEYNNLDRRVSSLERGRYTNVASDWLDAWNYQATVNKIVEYSKAKYETPQIEKRIKGIEEYLGIDWVESKFEGYKKVNKKK